MQFPPLALGARTRHVANLARLCLLVCVLVLAAYSSATVQAASASFEAAKPVASSKAKVADNATADASNTPNSAVSSVLSKATSNVDHSRWSQLADTIFSHLGTTQGLPHPGITAVVQDSVGFLWVGTQGGLARWDGVRFRVFLPDPKDEYSIPSSSIQSLQVDDNGHLWVGTNDAGVAYYDPVKDHFVRFRLSAKAQASVMTMAQDSKGMMWIGTSEGLFILNPKTGDILTLRHDALNPNTIPNNFVRSILRDNDGVMWVATRGGLARQRGKREDFEQIHVPVASGSRPNVLSLALGQDGRIWLGTSRQGAFVVDKLGVQALPLSAGDVGNVGLERDSVSFVAEAAPGQIWFGTYGKGIVVFDSVQRRGYRIVNDASVPTSLANNWALAAWRDRSGLFWVGTRGGLSHHDPSQRAILSMFGNSTRVTKLNDTDIFSVAQMPNGEIWVGSGVQGVNILAPHSGQVGHLKVQDQEFNSVRAIVHDGAGTAYVATNGGIYRSSIKAEERKLSPIPVAMPDLQVITMLADGDVIWLGAINGLWRYDLRAQTISRVAGSEALNQVVITALDFDEKGRIWVGTRNKGLYNFDYQLGTIRNVLAVPKEPESLSSNVIGSLTRDSRGRLWVATQGGGINLMLPMSAGKTVRFQRIGTERRFSHALVNKIIEDTHGGIWASTDDGIWLIDPNTFAIQTLNNADGVVFPTYLGNSGIRTAEGELVFGGNGGLTVVRPQLFQRKAYNAEIAVVEVKVGGKPVRSGRFNLPKFDALLVPAEENNVSIEFAAMDFTAPERIQYAYRLEGFEKQWTNSDGNRRIAAYTNLPAGDYRLRLRATNRNGEWLGHELAIALHVESSWYQSLWFRFLLAMAALFAVYSVVQWRTRYLRLRENLLDKQVQQRTEQLQQKQSELLDTNLALNQSNTNLALSVETLRQLGDIGRELTANLNADIVFEALYKHLELLLPANSVVIYRFNGQSQELELAFGREEGRAIRVHRIPISEPTSYLAQIAREPRELLIEFDPITYSPAHVPGTQRMLSALYAPMVLNEKILGVMSIQSARSQAYGERELFIFRTLLAYVAIALANADAMTALTAAQMQLAQQEKMASLGALVGGVAHEINTPLGNALVALSGLQGIWEQLHATFQQGRISLPHLRSLTQEGDDYLHLAMRTATRAAELVTSFKAIASAFDSANAKQIQLDQYLPEVARMVWGELQQEQRVLEVFVEPGLQVFVVQDALTETLSRVIHNVIDHAQQEGKVCRATLRAYLRNAVPTDRASVVSHHNSLSHAESEIVIDITDNGPGIIESDVKKVFDPFFSTKSGAGGHMGLGLHVAYNHVLQHLRGQIEIQSELGQGTTVRIRMACSHGDGKAPQQ